jgi:type IV pilus assembly protein PilQ
MMRRTSYLGRLVSGFTVWAVLANAGCAPPPAVLEEPTRAEADAPPVPPPGDEEPVAVEEETTVSVAGAPPAPSAPAAGEGLEIREIKVIDDNGQQGVFAKLSRAPQDVSHFTLAGPNRLVIEVDGGVAGATTAAQYPVDNPVIERLGVGSHNGKIRLTVTLRGKTLPPYTVDALNDTLVAFLGEPTGSGQPVREQLVFTQRPVPGVPRPPAPVPAAPPPAAVHPPAAPAAAPPVAVVQAPPEPEPARAGQGKLYYGQPVSLDLKDADIHNVLRLLAEVSKLNIVATDDVRGKITLRLFDVPWDQAFDIILQVMNLESTQEGNVIRISTVTRLREEREELARAQQAQTVVEPLEIAYIRINYAKAANLAALMTGAGAAEGGGVLSNRGSVVVDEFTNTLIIRDIASGIVSARDLVRRLDIQTPQILIESNIVEATTDSARQLGVQWGYRLSVGPQTGTSTGVNFPGSVGLGGTSLGISPTGVPFMADFPARGNFGTGNGSAVGLSLGSLNGAQALDVALTALEEEGKARVISRPRVVTLNNVAATIKSLTVIRVRLPQSGTNINTGAGGSVGGAQQATEKIETGIVLVVTPQVSSDGFVLLDMFTKSSQADFSRQVDNIPTEITREATSHVLVRDGQTIVLGGIYRDTVNDNVKGIPFFMDIPGIGWLFRSEDKTNRREDLLVFLTPRVVGGNVRGDLPTAAELWRQRDTEGAS